ncbi:MAG: hypothetical protein KVP17_004531 [Porospora cf. gigantea B]|uniref:uncharacterized protein n=2 Tax=Porospora cf. gigantea B TaxID=2853592 RepID=UPI003571913F|nr:MAG: hypothetical protein KVP17_004531 [Porospora cf. gigantea B]
MPLRKKNSHRESNLTDAESSDLSKSRLSKLKTRFYLNSSHASTPLLCQQSADEVRLGYSPGVFGLGKPKRAPSRRPKATTPTTPGSPSGSNRSLASPQQVNGPMAPTSKLRPIQSVPNLRAEDERLRAGLAVKSRWGPVLESFSSQDEGLLMTPRVSELQSVIEADLCEFLRPNDVMRLATPQDFEILKLIGSGSYGNVFLVHSRLDNCHYAMKVLTKDAIVRKRQIEHTLTERRVLLRTQHPFVVSMYHAFQTPRKLFYVLKYCPGGELFFHLSSMGRFSEHKSRFYAAVVALALGHLHANGIVYRDLKPENIVLDLDGYPNLTDFGLAKDNMGRSRTNTLCGTPEYLAPEVLKQEGHGYEVDWWALGALIFEMLTGLPPFYSKNREELLKNIKTGQLEFPAYLSANAMSLLRQLLKKNPEKRLGSYCPDKSASPDVEQLKQHPWFAGIDWEALMDKRVQAPYVPELTDITDVRHFDNEFVRAPVEKWQREEESPPVEGLDPSVFANWTYDYRWGYRQAIRVHIVQVRMRSVNGLREIVTVAENSRWRVAMLSLDLGFGLV